MAEPDAARRKREVPVRVVKGRNVNRHRKMESSGALPVVVLDIETLDGKTQDEAMREVEGDGEVDAYEAMESLYDEDDEEEGSDEEEDVMVDGRVRVGMQASGFQVLRFTCS